MYWSLPGNEVHYNVKPAIEYAPCGSTFLMQMLAYQGIALVDTATRDRVSILPNSFQILFGLDGVLTP